MDALIADIAAQVAGSLDACIVCKTATMNIYKLEIQEKKHASVHIIDNQGKLLVIKDGLTCLSSSKSGPVIKKVIKILGADLPATTKLLRQEMSEFFSGAAKKIGGLFAASQLVLGGFEKHLTGAHTLVLGSKRFRKESVRVQLKKVKGTPAYIVTTTCAGGKQERFELLTKARAAVANFTVAALRAFPNENPAVRKSSLQPLLRRKAPHRDLRVHFPTPSTLNVTLALADATGTVQLTIRQNPVSKWGLVRAEVFSAERILFLRETPESVCVSSLKALSNLVLRVCRFVDHNMHTTALWTAVETEFDISSARYPDGCVPLTARLARRHLSFPRVDLQRSSPYPAGMAGARLAFAEKFGVRLLLSDVDDGAQVLQVRYRAMEAESFELLTLGRMLHCCADFIIPFEGAEHSKDTAEAIAPVFHALRPRVSAGERFIGSAPLEDKLTFLFQLATILSAVHNRGFAFCAVDVQNIFFSDDDPDVVLLGVPGLAALHARPPHLLLPENRDVLVSLGLRDKAFRVNSSFLSALQAGDTLVFSRLLVALLCERAIEGFAPEGKSTVVSEQAEFLEELRVFDAELYDLAVAANLANFRKRPPISRFAALLKRVLDKEDVTVEPQVTVTRVVPPSPLLLGEGSPYTIVTRPLPEMLDLMCAAVASRRVRFDQKRRLHILSILENFETQEALAPFDAAARAMLFHVPIGAPAETCFSAAHTIEAVLVEGPFDYLQHVPSDSDPAEEAHATLCRDAGAVLPAHDTMVWVANFGDANTFGYFESALFAQDEVQAVEHPHAAAWKYAELPFALTARTNSFLFTGIPRLIGVDTTRCYGRQYARMTLDAIEQASHMLPNISFADPAIGHKIACRVPLTHAETTSLTSNIFSMTAPNVRVRRQDDDAPPSRAGTPYTRNEFLSIFSTALHTFRAIVDVSRAMGKRAVICTGAWGCGAFGGNLKIMHLLQLAAAHACEVEFLQFHAIGATVAPQIQWSVEFFDAFLLSRADSGTWTAADLHATLEEDGAGARLVWGRSNGT
eukprot:gnl/Chilomastix_cuspidata/797.p1 GENE.gnl/Chilomastix_cuspidata/797~~gnl/Chilomastix_cuspidata/797.p1  ORF type:complete len:1027 (+),score=158.33 gnl/Chilomastix_cuspidata/797:59-3139(+)